MSPQTLFLGFLAVLLPVGPIHAGLQVAFSRDKVCYRRTFPDPGLTTFGIGRPPRRIPPDLWYAYDRVILQECDREGVDPYLVKAIIENESAFRWQATSRMRAKGLMQLMDSTAHRMGVEPGWNPIPNLQGGIRYLASLQARYNGNLIKVIAAFNAGEGSVDRHDGVPPFHETRAYVPQVLASMARIARGE